MMRSSRDAEENGRDVRSTIVSVWARDTTVLSSMPRERCHALRPSAPKPVDHGRLGHGGHVTQGMEAEPVQSCPQVGGYREQVGRGEGQGTRLHP